jgi:hypothetical protein
MIDNVEGSFEVEEDHVCDSTGLEKGVKDGSVNASRVMATEPGLRRLHSRLATGVEAAEE